MTSIDQQGSLRLTQSLIGLSKSSYWLSIRLTRYRTHPPHTFIHIHISICYIAAKQPLNPYTTYEFNVEAFTVAHRNDILSDGNENDDYKHSNRVGSPILQLGLNNRFNNTNVYYDWSYSSYKIFSCRFSKSHLILIHPIEELINQTNIIELHINVTKNDNNQGTKMQLNVKIVHGDPLSLFSIDPTNQSLVLIDESLSRSYIYPINLTIIDISQKNIVPLTDQEQKAYKSLIIRAFDPFIPLNDQASNITECVINSNIELSSDISIRNLAVIN
ncbi:unnamed protein product [Rotaria sordida]|uniref:Uncharacterized protein n=1 Tax=Rotaria sordida TaxID=392033 RepID=A0A819IS06_9BILA|nr:unnamed protein product [Rotaria sordida]CAF3918048.1 unnamed protein product [Rotaria sordida]